MLDLSTLFDYDLWATRRWLHTLTQFQNLARAHEVLEEIVTVQREWLILMGVEVPIQHGNLPMQAVFVQLNGIWKHVVEDADMEAPITYELDEESFTNTARQIAHHVLTQGTFCRGQLAELAHSEGLKGLPETELLQFLDE